MKYSLAPILSLFSGPLLAHPGHAAGVSDHGFIPLVLVVALVVACLYCVELLRTRRDSTRNDPPND